MENIEVAQAMIGNALAYAKSGDMETVTANLEFIERLLEAPHEENSVYDWDDFK